MTTWPEPPTCDVRHGQAKLAGTVAIDIDVERWEVPCLCELEIAEERQLSHLIAHVLCKGVVILKADTLYGYFNGRGGTEAHDLRNDIGSFKRDLHAWQFPGEICAQSFAQCFASGCVSFTATWMMAS